MGLRALLGLCGIVAGFLAGWKIGLWARPWAWWPPGFPVSLPAAFGLALAALFGIAGVLRGARVLEWIKLAMRRTEEAIGRMAPLELVSAAAGSLFGLILGLVLMPPLSELPAVGTVLPSLASLSLAYVGWRTGLAKAGEARAAAVRWLGKDEKRAPEPGEQAVTGISGKPKVLDTSALIDGRIADVLGCGFLEGELVVPEFVMEELRGIAGSSDAMKRNRGKRGLEILDRLQREAKQPVRIWKGRLRSREVDSKVVELAQLLGGQVITVDYNLNKVAELNGVRVLNVNDLANAVKPAVMAGEKIEVYVLREGKEEGQGVGYLDDGTMVVIDGGKRYIGATVSAEVTSVLESPAGKMIFAKPSQAA